MSDSTIANLEHFPCKFIKWEYILSAHCWNADITFRVDLHFCPFIDKSFVVLFV